ncbi:hypothetical protein PO909_011264 [Leuciscus waleckii]
MRDSAFSTRDGLSPSLVCFPGSPNLPAVTGGPDKVQSDVTKPCAANSGRKLLALSGYPNGCRSAFCLSPLYTMNAFALMSCVWVLSLARFVYSLVKGVIMSNSGKLWHLSVGVFERTRNEIACGSGGILLKRVVVSQGSCSFACDCVPGYGLWTRLQERGFVPLCLRLHACLNLLWLIVMVV